MPTNTATTCLAKTDGSYGSDDGDRVPIYFFYQVEAIPGTTETLMNGVVLDDLEITLVDFLLPRLFDECSSSAQASTLESPIQRNGRYVGISSNPADFVLRGCKLF